MLKKTGFIAALALSLSALSAPAQAQRLLVINCDDGELRSWPGWIDIDLVTAADFLTMPASQVATYDVIEASHCVDATLSSEAMRIKLLTSVRRGTSLYTTIFNQDTTWLPGQVEPSLIDSCADGVTVPAAAQTHPLITGADPDVRSIDLSNVGCSLHGSFVNVSSEYTTLAVSNDTSNPVMIAAQFSCGRVFARSQHFHSNTEARAVRVIDAIADWLLAATGPGGPDTDGDGIPGSCDNCPAASNASQIDCDGDGTGDACDATGLDTDNDGVDDDCDSCPLAFNPNQPDDSDGDGVDDDCDNCPARFNREQNDGDNNLIGDACDLDTDNDRVPDTSDNCPLAHNPLQIDSDGNLAGDSCQQVTLTYDYSYFDDITLFRADPRTNTNFPSMQVHGTSAGPTKSALLYFDMRDVPAEAEIIAARLHVFQTVKDPILTTFHFSLVPWGELQVTWASFADQYDPLVSGSHLGLIAASDTHVDIDVTNMVRAWHSGERPNYGILMRTSDEGVIRFGATERMDPARRPLINIDAILPEPPVSLLVADTSRGDGLLYAVNGITGAVSALGPIGFDVTAMAVAGDGTIYGTAIDPDGYGSLITIDARTGAGTLVGRLSDGARNFTAMPDCTFRKTILYCWTELDDRAATVDVSTGEVNLLGGGTWAYGVGFATDAADTIHLLPHGPEGDLYTMNPSSGEVLAIKRLRGTRENITAMTFAGGRLFAIEQDSTRSYLVSIDRDTGAFTTIGELPPYAEAITTPRARP